MDIPKTLFATLVKQGRMEMHLTQEALAEKLGISAAYLGDLERHKGGPSLELFCKTMQTLNISADDYVYPNQNKNNSTYDQIRLRIQDESIFFLIYNRILTHLLMNWQLIILS